MALSEDRIYEIAEAYGTLDSEYRRAEFARTIEAEVRKEYTGLIRQLVEALKESETPICDFGPAYTFAEKRRESAIATGRARLEGKT